MANKQKTALTQEEQTKRHKRVAEELRKGAPISRAMIAAGYSKGRANRGVLALPEGVVELLSKRGQTYARLGRKFSPEQRAEIVRGALVRNVMERQDRGVRSIELLGRDVAVGVFKNDAAMVNVQINLPPGLEGMFPELATVPPIEASVQGAKSQ